jgi:hypothetical protein
VDDTSGEQHWRLELFERRRVVYEQLLWQIPSASFAGQAFLLNIVLGRETSSVGRLIAALFGLGAALGVLIAYIKHRYTEESYAEWVNGAELRASRPKITPPEVQRQAYAGRPGETFRWDGHRLRWLTTKSAFEAWAVLLVLFVLGDLLLVVMAVVEVLGGGTWLR